MERKTSLRLLVVLMFIITVAFSSAAPTTRSLKEIKYDASVKGFHCQDWMLEVGGGEDGLVERRIDIEITDYPGAGANNHHDPRTPGGN